MGDGAIMPAKVKDRPTYFWSKVSRGTSDECWPWKGGAYKNGYGQLQFDGQKLKAHRYAAFLSGLVTDPVAPRFLRGSGFVLHTCDNKLCCNPAHLEVGTFQKNTADAVARGRYVPGGTKNKPSIVNTAVNTSENRSK